MSIVKKQKPAPAIDPSFKHIKDMYLRTTVLLHAHDDDNLSDIEHDMWGKVQKVLKMKLKDKDYEIDIVKMLIWFREYVTELATEFYLRRLINKYEYEHVGHKIFTIKNGEAIFTWEDEIRLSCFQAWATSGD